jgi:hypothetical protein
MCAVRKDEQLAKVAADLARGHTHPALQRLANLTALFPDDLDIRACRAAVNRQIGDAAGAGRWGFLTEQVSPNEVAAFERAFGDPADRLRALRLHRHPGARLGPLAADRLQDLVRRAKAAGGAARLRRATPMDTVVPVLGCAAVVTLVLAVLGLALIGLISLVSG